jgi:hypothetical protein
MKTETRIVKTRDAATAALRKLGVNSRDYGLFIEKQTDGTLMVKLALAEQHLKPAPKVAAKLAKVEKEPRVTVSSEIRRLILEGKTNQEVWTVVAAKYRLDASKKHYPTWYRCQLKREKLLKESK